MSDLTFYLVIGVGAGCALVSLALSRVVYSKWAMWLAVLALSLLAVAVALRQYGV